MGGKGGSGVSTTTVRYAPYIETQHTVILDYAFRNVEALEGRLSPFSIYTRATWDIEDAMLGIGILLTAYDSLFKVFGDHLHNLDIDALHDDISAEMLNGAVVNDLISSENTDLSDNLIQEVLPRFETGLRDINSVISSSFVVGRAMIEASKVKAITRFSAEIRTRLLPIITSRWETTLKWNQAIFESYSQLMKFYISQKMDVENHVDEIESKDQLWYLTIAQNWVQIVSALSGAQTSTAEVKGASGTQKILGGVLSGAAQGAMLGGPVGAGIGGLVGLASSMF
jgi:hypothetical protein